MVIKKEKIPVQTIAAGETTDTYTTGKIHGVVLGIKIYTEENASFKISTAKTPTPTQTSTPGSGSLITEYLLGTSGAAVAVTKTDKPFYPRVVGQLASTGADLGAANQTNVFVPMVIDSSVTIDVSSGTAAKTWAVEFYYQD